MDFDGLFLYFIVLKCLCETRNSLFRACFANTKLKKISYFLDKILLKPEWLQLSYIYFYL